MTLRLGDYCGLYLSELAVEDDRIWVIDGDLADSDGAIHFAQKHPERFLMAGIAEQCMVSTAAGMASCGVRPWVFSFASFLCYRAYDQIRTCISQTKLPVTLVGSHSGGCTGRNGKTHAALNDIALIASLPNFKIWSPSDHEDLKFAIRSILAEGEPAYLRLPRRQLDDCLPSKVSSWRWLSAPSPIVLISSGLMTHIAFSVLECLTNQEISVGLIHCLQLAPLPVDLCQELAHTKCIFVIEDHYTFGGLASLIHQLGLPGKVYSIGWPGNWSGQSGSDEDLLFEHNLSAEQLTMRISTFIQSLA
jgi:transketolase